VISVLGVMLGVAVLVVVLSVMSGFDDMWRDKILGFNSHITIEAFGLIDEYEALIERVEAVPGVDAAAPYVQSLVFLQVGSQVATPIVRGVDPAREKRVSRVPEHIADGAFSLADDEAVIGKDLARQVGVDVGDTILLSSPQGFADPDEVYLPHELQVSGIFELGMWEFDVGFVLTSIDTARDLCRIEDGVHGVQVMTVDPLRVQPVGQEVQQAAGIAFVVSTWEELNRPLFAALRVEKNMMFILLICITLVAAFSICNTLITMTVQKTREIGLLKAIGYTPGLILRIFLWQGWIQGILGTFSGIGAGLLMLHYRNALLGLLNRSMSNQLLPKNLYHLSEIPSSTSVNDIVLVAASVMLICTVAALIPAYRAARLDPARALRYE